MHAEAADAQLVEKGKPAHTVCGWTTNRAFWAAVAAAKSREDNARYFGVTPLLKQSEKVISG